MHNLNSVKNKKNSKNLEYLSITFNNKQIKIKILSLLDDADIIFLSK